MDTHLTREVTGQLLFVCLNGSLLCYFFCSSEAEQTLLFLCLYEVKKHTGTDFQIKTLSGSQFLLTLRISGNTQTFSPSVLLLHLGNIPVMLNTLRISFVSLHLML